MSKIIISGRGVGIYAHAAFDNLSKFLEVLCEYQRGGLEHFPAVRSVTYALSPSPLWFKKSPRPLRRLVSMYGCRHLVGLVAKYIYWHG